MPTQLILGLTLTFAKRFPGVHLGNIIVCFCDGKQILVETLWSYILSVYHVFIIICIILRHCKNGRIKNTPISYQYVVIK